MKTADKNPYLMILFIAALIATCSAPSLIAQEVNIYLDSDTTSFWSPSGWMPNSSGIVFNSACTDRPRHGKTCIEIGYQSKTTPWAGIYWLAGGTWGETPGLDVYKLLHIRKGTPVYLSFWARGKKGNEKIECKVGGVSNKKYPDSMPFPISTGIITLSQRWERYVIDLTSCDLQHLIGGFCWVSNQAQNPYQDSVWFYLDEIEFFTPHEKRVSEAKMKSFVKKMKSLRWICYSPTAPYNPVGETIVPAPEKTIRADLKVLRKRFNGLIIYGAKNGLEKIPQIAKESKFKGCIAGIWDPIDKEEIENVILMAKAGLIDAVCVGNENLNRLYGWETLVSVMEDLRSETGLPITTTEEIEDYGDRDLLLQPDFIFVNIHPFWHGITSSKKAVDFVIQKVKDLKREAADRPIFVKETGQPSRGANRCTQKAQKKFWRIFQKRARGFAWAYFEAYDCPWKEEKSASGNVGAHWGLYTAKRRPKKVIRIVPRMKKNRR